MACNYVSEVISILLKYQLAKPANIIGCTKEEVNNLEKQLNVKFPIAYKQFLLEMGHCAGSFFRGTNIYVDNDFFDLQRSAKKILDRNGNNFSLPSNAFVFSMHQGYQFNYFHIDQNEDPPVYFYEEVPECLEKRWDKFSQFLLDSAKEEVKLIKFIRRMEAEKKLVLEQKK